MATKYEGKNMRYVGPHKRKSPTGKSTVFVESYYQRYQQPRGVRNITMPDKDKNRSRTEWLKDPSGHFVGRANARGQSVSFKRYKVTEFGLDNTANKRERGKYGRVYGRTTGKTIIKGRRKR